MLRWVKNVMKEPKKKIKFRRPVLIKLNCVDGAYLNCGTGSGDAELCSGNGMEPGTAGCSSTGYDAQGGCGGYGVGASGFCSVPGEGYG